MTAKARAVTQRTPPWSALSILKRRDWPGLPRAPSGAECGRLNVTTQRPSPRGRGGPGGTLATGRSRSARFVTPAGVPIADPLDQDDADDPNDHAKAEADAGAEIGHRG